MRKKEVLVRFVFIRPNLKIVSHASALNIDRLRLALLLREDTGNGKAAELHLGFDAEEALAAGNE